MLLEEAIHLSLESVKEAIDLSALVSGEPHDGSVKVKEVIQLLEADGWFLVTQKGSHRQLKHATKPGRVTIAGKLSHDLPKGTLGSILRQAQLKERGPQ